MIDPTLAETNVRVYTRIRPLLPKEKLNGEESCVKVSHDSKQVIVGKDRGFTFDGVFGPKATQDDLYSAAVKDLVSNLFDGYNSTIFAYGQTGSGKTYTMGTFNQEELLYDEKGIVPRAVEEIFSYIKEKADKVKFTVSASFIEVYKEEVRDLLDPNGNCNNGDVSSIQIREDDKGNTILCGIYEHLCTCQGDLLECLEIGSANRVTGATQMNEHSSRSHCVFTVNVVQEWNTEGLEYSRTSLDFSEDDKEYDLKSVISGKFHFVDLAGSERAHKTGNVGDRFKESIHINSGLLALGNVISALGDPKKKKIAHIPYRESKITRILKDSLGGNARTLMIACISPAVSNYDETVNALKYANRARNIRNKPIQNHDKHSKQIVKMQSEIIALREQLSRQKAYSIIQEEPLMAVETELVDASTTPRLGGDYDYHGDDCTNNVNNNASTSDNASGTQLRRLCYQAKQLFSSHLDAAVNAALMVPTTQSSAIGWISSAFNEDWLDGLSQWYQVISNLIGYATDYCSEDAQLLDEIMQLNITKLRKHVLSQDNPESHRNDNKNKDNQILDLEQTNIQLRNQLDDFNHKIHDYESRLVDQQRELTQYRRELRKYIQQQPQQQEQQQQHPQQQYNFSAAPQSSPDQYTNPTSNPLDNSKRIKQSPTSNGKKLISSAKQLTSSFNTEMTYNSRKIKSTPNMFNPGIMLSRFAAQSHFLLTEFENEDEVVRPQFNDPPQNEQITNHDDKLQKSYSKQSLLKQSNKIFSSQHSREDSKSKTMEDSSGAALSTNAAAMTTDVYKKQIKISQLKLTDANQKLRDLSINIKLKEQLIKDLVKSTKDTGKVNKDYEDKINQLEQEKEETNQELERLQQKLLDISLKNKDNESVEVKRIKELNEIIKDYESRMEMAQKKLNDLQKKQKETQKLSQLTSNHEKKIGELMTTVERLKQEQSNMQRKLKLENDTKQKLEKDLQRDQERIKQLEIQNEHQQKILRRKQEEIMAANRKLRRGSNSTLSNDVSPKIDDQKKWLDDEIEKVIQYKKQVEELDIDVKKREEILSKKEALLLERSEFSSKFDETTKGSTTSVLTVERDNLKMQKMKLEEKLQAGSILSEQEERWISELDEAIEALDEAIEFKTEIIDNKAEALRQSQMNVLMSREDIAVRLTQIGPEESRQLLMRYFEKVIDLRENIRKVELVNSEKELQIEELQHMRDQLQRNIERQTLEFDRRYTQLQSTLESEKQLLMRQIVNGPMGMVGGGDAEIGEDGDHASKYDQLMARYNKLEKEAHTYRKTCREMKSKIKDWVLSGRLKADIDLGELIQHHHQQTPANNHQNKPSAISARPLDSAVPRQDANPAHKSYDPGNYVAAHTSASSITKITTPASSINSTRTKKSTNTALVSSNNANSQRTSGSHLVTYSSAQVNPATKQTSTTSLAINNPLKITPITNIRRNQLAGPSITDQSNTAPSITDSLDDKN